LERGGPVGKTIVLALGGNAITRPGQKGTFQEQLQNIRTACQYLVGIVASGHRLVITHGNGPQVGNLLLKNEMTREVVPPMPLDVCVANTQGSLGYGIQQSLAVALQRAGLAVPVVSLVTQVVVDPADPAFQNPTKPIGPFYTEEEAKSHARTRGYTVREDSGRGWRRVVPSPEPVEILEREAIRALLQTGCVVVAGGGGGIPVVRQEDGDLKGVAAVIDKDLAGCRLAADVGADVFMVLTDVPQVMLDFNKPSQRPIIRMTVAEARQYLADGQFPPGSMGPKVQAACRFVEAGGNQAIIGAMELAAEAIAGTSGTSIVP